MSVDGDFYRCSECAELLRRPAPEGCTGDHQTPPHGWHAWYTKTADEEKIGKPLASPTQAC